MNLSSHPADDAEAMVVGQSWDLQGPVHIPAHSHRRGQLVYTDAGCVSVEVMGARFVAPPHRAVWLPPGVVHAAFYPRAVAFRGLFFDADFCRELPSRTTVLQVDALCRELIRTAVDFPWSYTPNGPEARLTKVLTDRMSISSYTPLSLPGGKHPAVLKIMTELENNPADNRSNEQWASLVHLTERTLARRFVADTGMSLTTWRTQLRLIRAVERLAAGESVTSVAMGLGYSNPSSFTTMFKRALGTAPKAYFA